MGNGERIIPHCSVGSVSCSPGLKATPSIFEGEFASRFYTSYLFYTADVERGSWKGIPLSNSNSELKTLNSNYTKMNFCSRHKSDSYDIIHVFRGLK